MSADHRGNAAADAGELAPGDHLRAEIERLGLDQVAVSAATGVSRQSINNIVNGRQPISRAMAAKLGRLTGHTSDYWLRAAFPRATINGARSKATKAAATPARPLGVGVLVNHQIVRAVKDGIIGIDPFDEANVQMASIDLTLDDFVITGDGDKVDVSDQGFVLKGGRVVNVSTKEWVELPQDYIGRVGAMASLASLGIIISHGFQIDPGFKGNLHFCIFNAGLKDFELRGGASIISVEIMPLSATPAYDESAARHLIEARDRDRIASIFRNDVCDRMIRDAIRRRVLIEFGNDGAKARLSDLSIEILDASADAALADTVQSALNGLQTLRAKPGAAREDREKYASFFGDIAERLYLTGEQARWAFACLGLPIGTADTLVATLRDGADAVIPLPPKSARVSLRHLARQLREDPLDLILMLVGVRSYQALRA
jgi:deoxycytidine triphosphate deaminase/addiction module HigA family antidote